MLDVVVPVMALGGFTGSDPAPTLDRFQQYVASGQVRYVVVGGGPGVLAGRVVPAAARSAPG